MTQASALAIGSARALQHGSGSVVQTPLEPLYSDTTTYGSDDLTEEVTASLLDELEMRGGDGAHPAVANALQALVATMASMAQEQIPSIFFLSSLDPGLGKTTALIHFVQGLLRSELHDGVAVLLCFSRLEEIRRLIDEARLPESSFAVLTSDEEVNQLSSTVCGEARVLFTTHAMVKSRCLSCLFEDVDAFKYRGGVRSVRVWDEEMLPNEVVSLNTDQLASLRDPLRFSHPNLTEMIEKLERQLKASGGQGTFTWPQVEEVSSVRLSLARRGLEQRHASYLDTLYALSGRRVLLRKLHNASTVFTALDSREAIPDDLAPMVILDASGRVRANYDQWEKRKSNLVRLPSATRNYRNLTVHLMNKGAGKTAWTKNGGALAGEIAKLIDSKPEEAWLVVYHKGVNSGTIPDHIRGLLSTNPDRVSFLNWGKHQGTNEFRQIRNVILPGIIHYSETDYEMLARCCSGTDNDHEIDSSLVQEIKAGEHQHHILQALCRSAVRQGKGVECGHCNAYIITPGCSGIRGLLSEVFPGCSVKAWIPTRVKAKGKVQQALSYVERHFIKNPDEPLPFSELQSELGITSASNFRKTIRKHVSFMAGLEKLNIRETAVGNYPHRNALARKPWTFGPVENATYVMDV